MLGGKLYVRQWLAAKLVYEREWLGVELVYEREKIVGN